MTDTLSIWNLALSHVGNKAGLSSASPPYASREAELCGQYWPLARKFAIVKAKPSWARFRQAAALVDLGDYQPSQWQYTYTKPTNAVELIGVYEPQAIREEDRQNAVVEQWSDGVDAYDVIYTNVELAVVRYLKDVEDTSKYHPAFVIGVSWMLASYLCGPLIKGESGMKVAEACEQKAIAYLSLSETHDANQQDRRDVFRDGNHAAPWVGARGFGDGYLSDAAPIIYEE